MTKVCLTPSEYRILPHMLKGQQYKVIAIKLNMQHKSAKWIARNILAKFGATNKSELISKFLQNINIDDFVTVEDKRTKQSRQKNQPHQKAK